MPTTRRKASNHPSTHAARAAQPTLTFNSRINKVTKPSITPISKSSKLDKAQSKKVAQIVEISTPSPAPESVDAQIEEEPTTAELAIKDQLEQSQNGEISPLEEKARKVTDAQIKRYWKAKEDERRVARVHQQGLSLHDKILREYDLSTQYGPCIGIARTKRWKRANNLGLDPPIEVLAVLMKEEVKDAMTAQRAYVDGLMSGRFVID